MFRLTLIVNALVPALLISLLWIECKNTVGTPNTTSLMAGLLLAVAPYSWLSVLAYSMKQQSLATRLTSCAVADFNHRFGRFAESPKSGR